MRTTSGLPSRTTRAFPIVILAIPLAVTYLRVGLDDTVIGVAFMHTALALPFTVLITSSVFVSVPRELEEAALVDGASRWQTFRRITWPLILPFAALNLILTTMWTTTCSRCRSRCCRTIGVSRSCVSSRYPVVARSGASARTRARPRVRHRLRT